MRKIKDSIYVFMFLVVIVAACSSEAGGTDPNITDEVAGVSNVGSVTDEETTVLRIALANNQQGQYSGLIDAFERANPEVTIKTVSIQQTLGINNNGAWPEDAYLSLASAADVMAAPATKEAVEQGALLDMTPFMTSDSNFESDDFYTGALESMQWDGGTWALPTEISYELISFNRELFDVAGLAYPEPGWTWNDFKTTAEALTIGDGDSVAQWGFVMQNFDPVPMVQARGGMLFDAETNPPTVLFESTEVVEAVTWFTDLVLTDQVLPYTTGGGGGGPGGFNSEGFQLINGGLAAMWLGFGGGFGGPNNNNNDQNGAVSFPLAADTDLTTPAEVDGWSISSGTNKGELAWEWVRFVAQQGSQQGGFFGGANTSTIPALRSVAASTGFWEGLEASRAAALTHAVDHALFTTYTGVGYDTFEAAISSILADGVAVNVALAEAQVAVEAEIETAVASLDDYEDVDIVVAEDEEAALEAGAVIIQFGTGGGGGFTSQLYRNLADQFQAENPDIIIEVVTAQGFGGGQGLEQQAAEYDCFQRSPSFGPDTDLSLILNMDPFLSADETVSKEDFYASSLSQFSYQGQLWGLPGNMSISVVNYNKALFEAAGLPYPSTDWTTNEFLETAVALSFGEDEARQFGYISDGGEINDLVTFLDRLSPALFDGSVDPPQLNYSDPAVVEAVRWYANIAKEFEARPIFVTDEQGNGGFGRGFGNNQVRQAYINEGRAAMWITTGGGGGGPGGGGGGGQGQNQADLDLGVAPLPVGARSEGGSGFRTVTGFFISSQTEVRQACWQWIAYLTAQPNLGNGLPSRIEVAESEAYRQNVGDEQADAYLASINDSGDVSLFQLLADEGGWLNLSLFFLSDAYNDIVLADVPVEEALDLAQEKMVEYRACVITTDAFGSFQAQQACMAEVNG